MEPKNEAHGSGMGDAVTRALNAYFVQAEWVDVVNESHRHQVPLGSETHFKVCVVDAGFRSLTRVQRHQRLYALLEAQLNSGLHALALHLYTPEEWLEIQHVPSSPVCQHHAAYG